ncbi:heme exporter protein CcmD [Solimonas terrae]|uniref:Heme exporter protein D n=1 Tax=Solimonas terrae TaxID=1396819 RepID=A0A6M2BTY1_9GAMM|nr:heme exporter protein CcmD [Solimonas terrae]
MGGYAVYVWGSFAAALIIYVWNVVAPRRRRRAILGSLLETDE